MNSFLSSLRWTALKYEKWPGSSDEAAWVNLFLWITWFRTTQKKLWHLRFGYSQLLRYVPKDPQYLVLTKEHASYM